MTLELIINQNILMRMRIYATAITSFKNVRIIKAINKESHKTIKRGILKAL
jgi:hypothetical protein